MNAVFLSQTALFAGNSPNEIESTLSCLGCQKKHYKKGSIICSAGSCMDAFGMVLTGQVSIEYHDFWGNRTVMAVVGQGQIFGETYACMPQEPLMVDVVAHTEAQVLWLKVQRMLHICDHHCPIHSQLIERLLMILARKNLNLSHKISHTTPKSIRGRLLSYLSHQATQHGNNQFSIPFDRQQLADYLNVDRSALSNELSKMQREGLLNYHKNQFTLHRKMMEHFCD